MIDQDLFDEVKTTIVDVLDLENTPDITKSTTAEDFEGWDSLQHVRILTALERKFRYRFSDEEIQGLKNVGDLISAISRHVTTAG